MLTNNIEAILTNDILVGIFVNVLSSFIFLGLVYAIVKPNLKLSPQISLLDGSSERYYFKIINKSIYATYDLKFTLYKITKFQDSPDFGSIKIEEIPLIRNEMEFLNRLPFHLGLFVGNIDFAVQIGTAEDLIAILNDSNTHVRLQVKSVHPLTAFSKIKYKDYHASNIICGSFKAGNTFRIK